VKSESEEKKSLLFSHVRLLSFAFSFLLSKDTNHGRLPLVRGAEKRLKVPR
jgi:hypothetical protein